MITMIKIIIIAGAWYLRSARAAVQFFRSTVSICGGGKIRVTLSQTAIFIIIIISCNNVIIITQSKYNFLPYAKVVHVVVAKLGLHYLKLQS